jgi:hypothetical protein
MKSQLCMEKCENVLRRQSKICFKDHLKETSLRLVYILVKNRCTFVEKFTSKL